MSEGFLRQVRESTNIKIHHITDAVAEVRAGDCYEFRPTEISFQVEAAGNWYRLDTEMVLTAMLKHLLELKMED